MSSLFNMLYHGNMASVEELLESGVELDAQLTGALLCNIVRTIRRIEETRQGEPMDWLRWTCHDDECRHKWMAAFDPEYGEHDDDCPVCGSRHNAPERIEVRI